MGFPPFYANKEFYPRLYFNMTYKVPSKLAKTYV